MENKYIRVGLLYNDCVKLKSYCFIATMGVVVHVFAFRFALARSSLNFSRSSSFLFCSLIIAGSASAGYSVHSYWTWCGSDSAGYCLWLLDLGLVWFYFWLSTVDPGIVA